MVRIYSQEGMSEFLKDIGITPIEQKENKVSYNEPPEGWYFELSDDDFQKFLDTDSEDLYKYGITYWVTAPRFIHNHDSTSNDNETIGGGDNQ